MEKSEKWFEIEPQNDVIFLAATQPQLPVKQKRKTLREIGRSNAIDLGTPTPKTPNPKNYRLHGRKGSRGQGYSPQNSPNTIEPVELGLQVLRVQQRLDNLETKLAKERNERVQEMLSFMKE